MNIYIAHSNSFDFKRELYQPFEFATQSYIQEHNIVLPHKSSLELFNSKEYIPTCGLVIGEVSYPSTGIELTWADMFNIPIVGVYKKGTKPSNSLKALNMTFVEYNDADDLIEKLKDYLVKLDSLFILK